MTDFKLGNSAWGNSLISYAWSVQGANIENLKISNLAASSIGANAITSRSGTVISCISRT